MRKKNLIILLATALSGALSGYLLLARNDLILNIGPGLFFGLATSVVFLLIYKTKLWKTLLWAAASTLAWYAAIHLAMNNPDVTQVITPSSMTMAGGIGAFILVASYSFLIQKIGQTRFMITVIAGSLLGMAMYFVLLSKGGEANHLLYILSFVLWQVGVGQALTFERAAKTPKDLK